MMRMNKVYVESEALLGRTGHEAGRQLLARMYREVCGEDCPEIRIGDFSHRKIGFSMV